MGGCALQCFARSGSCDTAALAPELAPADRADGPGVARRLDRIQSEPRWKHPYDLMPGHPLPPF